MKFVEPNVEYWLQGEDVKGNVETYNGNVKCRSIGGEARTHNGNIMAVRIAGSVKTRNGNIIG